MWKLCSILIMCMSEIVQAGSLGDEADLIIRTIFTNYEPQAHPNSDREDGAVQVEVGVNLLSVELVINQPKSKITFEKLWCILE